jgi:hypothetical protein
MEADTRPSVQAILTADTLIDHYVRAVENVRRSLGRDEMEMSAQVSDANRTYPTIWEHLDHARGLLAAEGRDTSDFDRLREAAGGNTLLGIETDRADSVDLFGAQEQTLTVHFNLSGVNLAHRASTALKQAMRDVDWDAIKLQQSIPVADLKGGNAKWWALAAIVAAAALAALLMH